MDQVTVPPGICDILVGTQEKGTQFEASLGYITQASSRLLQLWLRKTVTKLGGRSVGL